MRLPWKILSGERWGENEGSGTVGKLNRITIYFQLLRMAERVGFAPLLGVENKALRGFRLSHDPMDPLESLGRDTY
jgi:hypothetical protein